ncbi:MAG: metal ABC transporter ATP-binding protein [Candidatus Aminicenantes bacterium]|nr:metal ABC transporter ATP-binding protein [Candidatus Aminicenantes bacterium]
MEPILEVKNLSVRFGNLPALEKVSFTIEKEEIIAIIGPNGSGKTTLLKAILGLIPYDGEIKIFAKDVQQVLPLLGYVPQHFAFEKSFPLTVEEFVGLTCRKPDQLPFGGVLPAAGMAGLKDKLVGELSGGQLQRVLIAHAMLHQPKILFLDEATSGIDIEGLADFYSTIQRLNREHGVTVLMVSHEISMVYKFSDRIICLNRDLISHGETKSALNQEVLKKLYGDSADLKTHDHHGSPS